MLAGVPEGRTWSLSCSVRCLTVDTGVSLTGDVEAARWDWLRDVEAQNCDLIVLRGWPARSWSACRGSPVAATLHGAGFFHHAGLGSVTVFSRHPLAIAGARGWNRWRGNFLHVIVKVAPPSSLVTEAVSDDSVLLPMRLHVFVPYVSGAFVGAAEMELVSRVALEGGAALIIHSPGAEVIETGRQSTGNVAEGDRLQGFSYFPAARAQAHDVAGASPGLLGEVAAAPRRCGRIVQVELVWGANASCGRTPLFLPLTLSKDSWSRSSASRKRSDGPLAGMVSHKLLAKGPLRQGAGRSVPGKQSSTICATSSHDASKTEVASPLETTAASQVVTCAEDDGSLVLFLAAQLLKPLLRFFGAAAEAPLAKLAPTRIHGVAAGVLDCFFQGYST